MTQARLRDDRDCRYMDRISHKYTSRPFPGRGPDRLCFVVEVEVAPQYTLGFVHNPGTSN